MTTLRPFRVIPITTPAATTGMSLAPTHARPEPARMVLDAAAAGEGPAAAVPPSTLQVACLLSLEVDLIAESLYRANCLLDGELDPVPFHRLPDVVCAAYRDSAIVSLQRVVPASHAAASKVAEAAVPGFGRALPIYLSALRHAPAGAAVDRGDR